MKKLVSKNTGGEEKFKSIRTELFLIIAGIIVTAMVLIGVVTFIFLEPFYRSQKISSMKSAYAQLVTLTQSEIDSSDEIKSILLTDNIQLTVASSSMDSYISTSREPKKNAGLLYLYVTGYSIGDISVLEQTDSYTLQMTDRETRENAFLEMWGQLDCGDYFLLQTPVQSLKSVAKMTLWFYLIIGALVILLSGIAVWLMMRRYTRPIIQLTSQVSRMADLDFDARYEGDDRNEIGTLGRNFNKMSGELEKTISELKTANVELQKENEHKTQIDEVRKEFLNNVSHELKTPIALIEGYAEGLKDNVAEDQESRDFYCDVIIDEAKKMNNMVRKLMTINQLEFGNDPVVMDRFNLTEVISGVLCGMQILVEDAGANVSFDESKQVYVWGDAFKIEEAITNYLSNALAHVSGEKRIEITAMETDGVVTVNVFNTGDPIPEEDLPHVFEKFYKVDKARTRSLGGAGLGLSIVKAIMDGHGGKCGVTNYENGVSFWLTLEGKNA